MRDERPIEFAGAMLRSAVLLAALVFMAPAASAQGFEFTLAGGTNVPILSDAGGLVGDSGDSEQGVKMDPFVLLEVETPISTFVNGPRLVVGAEYGSTPGVTPDIYNPETYRSFGMRVGVHQTLSDRLLFGLYAEAGFTTRLGNSPAPVDRAPRYAGIGVRFKGNDSELAVTLNADQRLSSAADLSAAALPTQALAYQATVAIRGRVPIPKLEFKDVKVSAYIQSVLGLEFAARASATASVRSGRHDMVNVGIMIGM